MTHGVEQPNTFGDLLRLSEPANAHDTGPALPVWLTSFVGRERDLAEVLGLLGTVRLLTLTGPGGIGKTRLAVAAAASDAAAFPDGVVAVELAALADPIMVPLVVASALRVSQEPGRPVLEALQTS